MSVNDRISALTPEQRALFERLREQKKKPSAPRGHQPPPIPRRGPGDHWPLSFDQERLWFLYTLDPLATAYNIDSASRIRGRLDMAALSRAFQEVPRRHESWRTSFQVIAGRPAQVIAPEVVLPSPVVDLCALPAELREPTAHELMVQETRRPFVLETGPLVRALFFRLDDQDHICQLTVHHIVTDWVTFQLFWYELGVLYEAYTAGRPSPLPELPVQYADFTVWQRSWLQGEVLDTYRDYWVERLAGAPLVLDLPTDRPRPAVQTTRGSREAVRVERAAELKSLARREGLTAFMAVLAVYQILLSRHAGQEKLIVGSPNANRNRREIEPVFGFFLTQLAFCTDLGGDPTLREALRRVRDVALGAYAHQELPFGKLVEALQPERDLSRAPVIQVVLLLLDGSVLDQKLADLHLEPLDIHDGNSRYDVMFAMWDQPDLIAGWYEYNADLWDAATASRMVEGFGLVIAALLADPDARLSGVPMMSSAARHQLLVEWNDTAAPLPDVTVLDLFEARAAERPEAPALVWRGRATSYGELDARAGMLAVRLLELGVRPGSRVGVCLERCPDMVAALLAVWKAAATYVPLDPEHPADRLGYTLADSAAAALITSEQVLAPLAAAGLPADLELLVLESSTTAPGSPPAARPLPATPAYAIYTSGSTGRPKGAEVPHSAVINLLRSVGPWCSTGVGDAWMAVTTISFDISVFELFLPLTTGARIVLGDRETALDGRLLALALDEGGATHLQATPATWRQLVDSGWAGRPGLRRLSSGEALSRDFAEELLALCGEAPFWNLYGPTETTVWSTGQRLEPGDRHATTVVTLGRPLDNTQVYVLDREMRPVPLGVKGEVFLGGTGLAQGYLGRPGLTADRFVPDPLAETPGARLYRTGDFVRWLADGVLSFLGRADEQVKLRGFRIEPGEIEVCLRQHPGVADAVVLLRQVQAGDSRLAAYVVPAGGGAPPPEEELRAALRAQLPEHMVPAAFIPVNALPFTPNGKVDRQALARIGPAAPRPAAGVAPRNATEELLAGFWETVLGAAPAGVDADFFTSGGHSLLATQLVLRIRDAFGLDLPVRAVFGAPTIRAQAEMIEGLLSGSAGPAPVQGAGPVRPLPRRAYPLHVALSFAQERLWFLDRLMPGSVAYNMPLALRMRGELDPAALERAFAELVLRHETLRTTFVTGEAGRPVQVVSETGESPAAAWSLSRLRMEEADEDDVPRLAAQDAALPFDLEHGPLLRSRLLRLGPADHVLLLSMHHIISDLWSMGVLVRDMAAFYAGASLPPLPVQYADFAVWQRAWLQGAELERQITFWRDRLAGAPPALDLSTDRPRPATQSVRGASLPFGGAPGLARVLEELARRHGATLFMMLTAALASVLARFAGQDDLVLGSPIANRQRPEIAGLIGMFVNTLALRVDLRGAGPREASFTEILGRVREAALDAFAHQDVPFEKLVEALQPRRDPSRHPLFQVVLAMQNVALGGLDIELPGLVLEPLEVESTATKFDLTLSLYDSGGDLAGRLEYAADLFDRATAERIAGALRTLLAAVAEDPGMSFRDLPLLAPEERRQILLRPNRTAAHYPSGATVHELFAAQAAATPGATAVVQGAVSLTYRELAGRADRLARRLLALGIGPEARIGLCAGRSPDLIVALLAILKAGGAYLPLDPSHPPERLAWMLRDGGARALLTERRLLGGLTPEGDLPAIFLEDLTDPTETSDPSDQAPFPRVPADSLTYVMYTSGSTGTPKGVAVTHRNVVRLVRGTDYADLGPEQTWLQLAPVSFDAATLEIWAPLLNGGRLVLFPGDRPALDDLADVIERQGVTSLWLTAGLFQQMVDHKLEGLRPLRQLLAGGDVVPPAQARRVLEAFPGLTLIDGYGPTEGTTFTCCYGMTDPRQAGGPVPIGTPIANARVYVLDPGAQPVPFGVAGELYIGGAGLARGYLDRPELTAERFVPDPFGMETGLAGERLYRTGDRVRWIAGRGGDAAGALELLGRIGAIGGDGGQVKIRGFRVEIGEVEATLSGHPAVRRAAVLARDEGRGKELAACVVPADPGAPPSVAELQGFLRGKLPEPMVPSVWSFLDVLPLTANGKLDRRVLGRPAEMGRADRAGAEHVAPRTPLEEHLIEVCATVLDLDPEQVGVLDNFFDLGGHSLLAIQLIAQLRARWSLIVPLQLVFDARDLADLAERITERELSDVDPELLAEMIAELRPELRKVE
ncbi:MAG TPA: amino acid adenylation domain-containing protein [Thermoanaerobaculia bacterium]|jgi:amino acid adenylation domain-containing protein|nr:amino acid adenylation domain-containing protein [Thermoanaerobaculia bacterium]